MENTVTDGLPLEEELEAFGRIFSLKGGEQESRAGGVLDEGGILDGDLAVIEGAIGMGLETSGLQLALGQLR